VITPTNAVFCGNPECHKAFGEIEVALAKVAERLNALERKERSSSSMTPDRRYTLCIPAKPTLF
jgi:hypothetical protein